METKGSNDWLEATKMANDALTLSRTNAAVLRAQMHVTMLMLTTLAQSAPVELVDKLLAEFERVRDLSGPAGAAAGEVFATAVSTLERASRRD